MISLLEEPLERLDDKSFNFWEEATMLKHLTW